MQLAKEQELRRIEAEGKVPVSAVRQLIEGGAADQGVVQEEYEDEVGEVDYDSGEGDSEEENEPDLA